MQPDTRHASNVCGSGPEDDPSSDAGLPREPDRDDTTDLGSALPREPDRDDTTNPESGLPREPLTSSLVGPGSLAELSAEQLCDDIAALARRLAAGTYELLVLVGEVDARGIWARHGALSCAAWLAELTSVERGTAHNQVRVARTMRTFPALDTAMGSGDVSYAKARVLVPYLDHHNADELVALAERTPASRLGAAIAARSLREDDPEVIAARQHEARSLSWRAQPDGTVVFTIRLTPQDAGRVCAVLEATVKHRHSATKGATLTQQRADALVDVVTDGGGTVDTEVVIHVRGDGTTLSDGTPVADHIVAGLLPEAFVSLLIVDAERQPIDASPRRRSPTRRQRRVIDERHPSCAHPGCEARELLEYDHIDAYAAGGRSLVDNFQRLCGPHNREKYQRQNQGDAA